jgi:hypothetical protein
MKNKPEVSQDINFSQLTFAEKTEINYVGHAMTDLVIYQSSSSRIKNYVMKFNPDIYAKHK